MTSFADYQRLLREDGRGEGELERAIELITTNETYFFRDLPQLRSFEREVVPELHRLAEPRRTLSIWSAGCSTGEEAYTIAILLARSQRFAGWNVRVFGNDISRRVVQTARKGIYRGSELPRSAAGVRAALRQDRGGHGRRAGDPCALSFRALQLARLGQRGDVRPCRRDFLPQCTDILR